MIKHSKNNFTNFIKTKRMIECENSKTKDYTTTAGSYSPRCTSSNNNYNKTIVNTIENSMVTNYTSQNDITSKFNKEQNT